MKSFFIKGKIIGTLVCVIFLASCQCNYSRHNDDSDRAEAARIVNEFYVHYELHEFSKTHKLFVKDYFKVKDSVAFDSSLSKVIRKYGEIADYNIIDYSTKVISGTNSMAFYELVYRVKYLKDSTTEYFKLEKNDKKIKIVEYTVNHKEI